MNLAFRPAHPADADAAIPLIHASGPQAFDCVFCSRDAQEARRFLRETFVRGRGRFAAARHVVACVDGAVAGIGTAYGDEVNGGDFLGEGLAIAQFYGWRAVPVVARGLRAEAVMRPPRRGEWMLAHLAVAPERRGSGVGARLVRHLLEIGRQAGKALAVLDVSVENPRAEALYARMGFARQAERASRLVTPYGRLFAHRRMIAPLR